MGVYVLFGIAFLRLIRDPEPPNPLVAPPAAAARPRSAPGESSGHSAVSLTSEFMLLWSEFALGLLIWLGVIWDGFTTIVLPHTVAPMRRLSGRFNRWSWRLWAALGRRIRPEGRRL